MIQRAITPPMITVSRRFRMEIFCIRKLSWGNRAARSSIRVEIPLSMARWCRKWSWVRLFWGLINRSYGEILFKYQWEWFYPFLAISMAVSASLSELRRWSLSCAYISCLVDPLRPLYSSISRWTEPSKSSRAWLAEILFFVLLYSFL